MPSGTPGSLPRRSANTRSLCLARTPLGITSKARMWPRRVVDVEHALVGRERKPVGQHEIVDEERERAEIRGEPVNAGKGQVPLLLRRLQSPGIGEIDRAVGFHHHIVWAVEPPPLKAVRQNRETAVELAPRHAPSVVLT